MRILIQLLGACGIFFLLSFYSIDQRQIALLMQWGEIKKVVVEPGLHLKIPILQSVHFFDKRVQTSETHEPERFITSEKKNVLVDSYIKWRIVDPHLFYISVGGDMRSAENRLQQTVNSGLREEFGKRTVHDVVSNQRDDIMVRVREKADLESLKIGIKVVDVRLRRIDLPTEVSGSVFRRMKAERERVANELRSEGAAAAEEIRAEADREKEVMIARANSQADKLRGQGDAEAAEIYYKAYSIDPEFYAFYRSMLVYQSSFESVEHNVIVLSTSSPFFKYWHLKEY